MNRSDYPPLLPLFADFPHLKAHVIRGVTRQPNKSVRFAVRAGRPYQSPTTNTLAAGTVRKGLQQANLDVGSLPLGNAGKARVQLELRVTGGDCHRARPFPVVEFSAVENRRRLCCDFEEPQRRVLVAHQPRFPSQLLCEAAREGRVRPNALNDP
ncbi:hypothetical protein D9M72_530670 [compost metagenome]